MRKAYWFKKQRNIFSAILQVFFFGKGSRFITNRISLKWKDLGYKPWTAFVNFLNYETP